MFGLIEEVYLPKAAEIFQIVQAHRVYQSHQDPETLGTKPLSIFALYFATNPEITPDIAKSYQISDIKAICEEMEIHLATRCAGLLEVRGDGVHEEKLVYYLHRTARDFIEGTDIWQLLLSYAVGANSNPNVSMLRSCIIQAVIVFRENEKRQSTKFRGLVNNAIMYAFKADKEKDRSYIALLDQLDYIIGRL
jgi:hypothetical protein